MKRLFLLLVAPLWMSGLNAVFAQQSSRLPAGFDADEYADMLWLAFYGISDSLEKQDTHTLRKGLYQRLFRSPEVGLYNRCEIYLRNDSVVVLSLRGTVQKTESWMENFYAGMIPAAGTLTLAKDYTFTYRFAARPDAMVHAGWSIGTGFLVKAYLPVLESLLSRGLHKIIVTGHSQGGALSFLNTSFLHYRFVAQYPQLQLKTYASAAPKPGNLYYAYDFEHIAGNAFAYRVVNADDWVPESPVSVQGVGDFNMANPLAIAPGIIKKQKFPERAVMRHVYNKMRKGSDRAAARYRRFLGKGVGKLVRRSLPGFVPPAYTYSSHYTTAGTPVVLMPDEEYRKTFVFDGANVFIHHMYAPYLWLVKKQFTVAELKN